MWKGKTRRGESVWHKKDNKMVILELKKNDKERLIFPINHPHYDFSSHVSPTQGTHSEMFCQDSCVVSAFWHRGVI